MIRQVKIDEYSAKEPRQDYVTVREFAGKLVLILGEDDARVELCFEDLERAWRAVKPY